MIDSHSHIYMNPYDDDRDTTIARAVTAGVTQLLQVGCNLVDSRQIIALCDRVPGIYAAVGFHPHNANEVTVEDLDALETLTLHPKVLAWGEIGLDFYYNNSPHNSQKVAFETQLQRAIHCNLPVVIHTREAEAETLDILRHFPIPRGGHVHCFTGTPAMAIQLLEMGFHIGFTGIVGFNKADNVRDALQEVPLHRLLIETDSPFLAPKPHRGKRNEPGFIRHVAEAIAQVKEVPLDDVLNRSTENFYRLYGTATTVWQLLATPTSD